MKKTCQRNFQNIPVEFNDALNSYKKLCDCCFPSARMPHRDWYMRIMWAELNKAAAHDPLASLHLKEYRKNTACKPGQFVDSRVDCPRFGFNCATCKHYKYCTEDNPHQYERAESSNHFDLEG